MKRGIYFESENARDGIRRFYKKDTRSVIMLPFFQNLTRQVKVMNYPVVYRACWVIMKKFMKK
ncbi:unnamed protein product [Staurois parvus]|uniref:Uncharacterized protein n=1 Tax=Staurois parvus TaxID=386267 RepID=A0ABN9E3E7_9NEOB|nr:unnamed protein product [Staurois parvus]